MRFDEPLAPRRRERRGAAPEDPAAWLDRQRVHHDERVHPASVGAGDQQVATGRARAPGPMSRSGTGIRRSTGSGRGAGPLDRAATPLPPASGRATRGPRALRRVRRPSPRARCVPVAGGADGPATPRTRRGPRPGASVGATGSVIRSGRRPVWAAGRRSARVRPRRRRPRRCRRHRCHRSRHRRRRCRCPVAAGCAHGSSIGRIIQAAPSAPHVAPCGLVGGPVGPAGSPGAGRTARRRRWR